VLSLSLQFLCNSLLAEKFGLGYGVITTQGAEHHNKSTKGGLKLTNNWTSGERSKYRQVLENEILKLFTFPNQVFKAGESKRSYTCSNCHGERHNKLTSPHREDE